ncbi:MAG: hypothetical protein KUG60_01685 [Gammaproteobacteria bacterium]|nr:hypothetical protein [Gammaproteobacteria bacterium]
MSVKTLLFSLFLSLCAPIAMAGSDHNHGHSHAPAPVLQATASTKATAIVAALVKNNKLDESWASTTPSSVEKNVYEGSEEWVAVFVNDKVTDTAKQKLYVFMTLSGDYIAANFTGD